MQAARFASALSTDSDSSQAEREVVTSVLEQLGGATPTLMTLFASHHHGAALEGLGRRIKETTGAEMLVGCTGETIVGRSREVERGHAISLWAVAAEGMTTRLFQVEPIQTDGGDLIFSQLPPVEEPSEATLLLFADPYTFPISDYLAVLNRQLPGVPAIGGMASGGSGPGQNLLFADGEVLAQGALGVVVEGAIEVCPVVSQGCRPVGKPWVITAHRKNLIHKLGGKPASEILMETLRELDDDDRNLLQSAPFIGLAIDATRQEFRRGDFLVRRILGLKTDERALGIDDHDLRNGQTVQFLVRDAASAGEDLTQLMQEATPPRDEGDKEGDKEDAKGGASSAGALLFSCNGRGTRMFDGPDHDVSCIQSAFDTDLPVAGFFAMGEIGPVGGSNFLHGFTASVALFRPRQS